jgi:hypothetical protein
MKPAIEVDITDFMKKMEKARFTKQEMADVLGAGAAVIKTTQKLLCPWKTGATRTSIIEHEVKNGLDIGPSTDYAPYIEYGTMNPNYPIQPFVVPSGSGQSKARTLKTMDYAIKATLARKGLLE